MTADYPLTPLADPSENAVSAYERLVEDLLSDDTQQRIADDTWRRPVSPEASRSADVPPLVELPFPTHQQVVDDLVADYAGVLRRPARTVYVLDVSGSMKGDRLRDPRSALEALPREVAATPVFTVLFGESNAQEMSDLAEMTGGRVFDAREQELEQVFREIRGYQ